MLVRFYNKIMFVNIKKTATNKILLKHLLILVNNNCNIY